MKQYNDYGILMLLASILALTSCDPQTCGTAYIVNQASDTLFIEQPGREATAIAPAARWESGPVCGLGAGQTPASMLLSITRLSKRGVACKKELGNDHNWTTTQTDKYDFEHRFTVTDADF